MPSREHFTFFSFLHLDRRILAVLSIIVTLLVIENADAIVADFLVGFNTSSIGIIVFMVISAGYLGGQFFLFKLIGAHSKIIKSRSKMIAHSLELLL